MTAQNYTISVCMNLFDGVMRILGKEDFYVANDEAAGSKWLLQSCS